ncbi:MAG TPA: ECF-type sigma factor [Pyrinomonadaceae bacterium]|jgi:RNA polymerase sigma factor (TIGR02999 family)|nr:ECF-type sigma factor [Pyrinomonadaceae bacterium]
MPELTAGEITRLLRAWRDGDAAALDALAPLVYAELHRLARAYMHGERADHVLHSSDLINEAWLRLIDWRDAHWQNRAHFFGVAAQMMRRILVDFARERETAKRGRSAQLVALEEAVLISASRGSEIIALDDALNTLAEFDARKSRIVELRFFAGLDVEETAAVLNVSPRTVKREWSLARAWLFRELRDERTDET